MEGEQKDKNDNDYQGLAPFGMAFEAL